MTLVAVEASRFSGAIRQVFADALVGAVAMPAHHQGPHGRFDAMIGPESTAMRGPNGWDGQVAWSSFLTPAIVGWTRSRAARRRLRDGVEIRVGSETGIVRQPHQGFTRWRREVLVELGGATWQWRHRGLHTLRFERPDGTAVAESTHLPVSDLLDDAAAPVEVALAVLTWFASLDRACRRPTSP